MSRSKSMCTGAYTSFLAHSKGKYKDASVQSTPSMALRDFPAFGIGKYRRRTAQSDILEYMKIHQCRAQRAHLK